MIEHYLLDVYLNGIVVFLFSAALISLVLWIVRPSSYRLRFYLRLIPLAKLVLDLFRYHTGHWVVYFGMDPAKAPAGSRLLQVMVGANPFPKLNVGFSLASGETFTMADWFTMQWPTLLAIGVTIVLLLVSLYRVTKLLWAWRHSWHHISLLCRDAVVLRENVALSDEATRPFSTPFQGGWVILPRQLVEELSKKELEAIIAHERQHLRWRDTWVLGLESLVLAFFWCVPGMKAWQRRIDLECEKACDQAAEPIELASALHKSARFLLQGPKHATALGGRTPALLKRVRTLLKRRRVPLWLRIVMVSTASYLGLAVLCSRLLLA